MRIRMYCAVLVLASVAFVASMASAARAAGTGLTVCNQNSRTAGVAVGYHSPGVNDPADHSILTGPFVSRGWTYVAAGECYTFPNPFGARYMFWFALTRGINETNILPNHDPHAVNTTNGLWSTNSDVFFCAASYYENPTHADGKLPPFTYEDENESETACHTGEYNLWLPVRKVDTWVDARVNFTGT